MLQFVTCVFVMTALGGAGGCASTPPLTQPEGPVVVVQDPGSTTPPTIPQPLDTTAEHVAPAQQPLPSCSSPDGSLVKEASPLWLDRRVDNIFPGGPDKTLLLLNIGTVKGIAVGDRGMMHGYDAVATVTKVFEFRCYVLLPHLDHTVPRISRKFRVWLNGADPEPWPTGDSDSD